MSMPVIRFTKEVEIKPELVEDLLVCAFEGGSNYWYDDLEALNETSTKSTASERFYENLVTHGFSLLDKETGEIHTISPKLLRDGAIRFHDNEPRHFNDAVTENSDASTGDVFLQTIVFGEVRYG